MGWSRTASSRLLLRVLPAVPSPWVLPVLPRVLQLAVPWVPPSALSEPSSPLDFPFPSALQLVEEQVLWLELSQAPPQASRPEVLQAMVSTTSVERSRRELSRPLPS